jgi:hypothetical protein
MLFLCGYINQASSICQEEEEEKPTVCWVEVSYGSMINTFCKNSKSNIGLPRIKWIWWNRLIKETGVLKDRNTWEHTDSTFLTINHLRTNNIHLGFCRFIQFNKMEDTRDNEFFSHIKQIWYCNDKQNSVALVLKRTIPIEWPPLVSEVSAKFSG